MPFCRILLIMLLLSKHMGRNSSLDDQFGNEERAQVKKGGEAQ